MAVNHPPEYCPICGQIIKRKNNSYRFPSLFFGDGSYVDYKGHKCSFIKKVLKKIKEAIK